MLIPPPPGDEDARVREALDSWTRLTDTLLGERTVENADEWARYDDAVATIRAALAAPPGGPPPEPTAWLIERHANGVAEWWTGRMIEERVRMSRREMGRKVPQVTTDVERALHFERQFDADTLLRELPFLHGFHSSEHIWMTQMRELRAAPSGGGTAPTRTPVEIGEEVENEVANTVPNDLERQAYDAMRSTNIGQYVHVLAPPTLRRIVADVVARAASPLPAVATPEPDAMSDVRTEMLLKEALRLLCECEDELSENNTTRPLRREIGICCDELRGALSESSGPTRFRSEEAAEWVSTFFALKLDAQDCATLASCLEVFAQPRESIAQRPRLSEEAEREIALFAERLRSRSRAAAAPEAPAREEQR